MPGQRIGSFIAAVFGLVYVLVNAGALPSAAAWALRGAALLCFAGVLIALFTTRSAANTANTADAADAAAGQGGPTPTPTPGPAASSGGQRVPRTPYGRGYWLIVVVEFAALFAGARLLSGPLGHPEAGVAWVSLVVGVHFFALAAHFRLRFFHLLGVIITLCGAVGLTLAFTTDSSSAVALIGGVAPGLVLLAFAWWGSTRGPAHSTVPQVVVTSGVRP